MTTIAERILEAIRFGPLDDDVLARKLGVAQRQSINQVTRRLAAEGRLRSIPGPDGKIVVCCLSSGFPRCHHGAFVAAACSPALALASATFSMRRLISSPSQTRPAVSFVP